MFKRVMALALQEGAEIYSRVGSRPAPVVAGAGAVAAAAGRAAAAVPRLFDEGPGYCDGEAITVTVYAPGRLAQPVVVTVSCSPAGRLSTNTLTLAAGQDSSASFSFTPPPDGIATLHYSAPGVEVPPPRRIYTLRDPVGHAAHALDEAAQALLARYGASHWNMADARADAALQQRAAEGQVLRAVADSGFGATRGNAMEMRNWIRADSGVEGARVPPVMRRVQGRWCADHSAPNCWGFWCRSAAPQPGAVTPPRRRVPYHLREAHFALVALTVPAGGRDGVAFQASRAEEGHVSELALAGGCAQARWRDAEEREVVLTSGPLAPGSLAVLTLCSQPGRQRLRVDGREVGAAAERFGGGNFAQMLIGWGFRNYVPDPGFEGQVFAVVTGKGAPQDSELALLERYLAERAGIGR